MIPGGPGARLIVLCEYRCAFADEPITEGLECWELPGPRYSLSVTQYASPDGDGDEAWISAEVTDPDALWQLLEDWSAARRLGEPAVSEARRALKHTLARGPQPARRPGPDPGSPPAAPETTVARPTVRSGIGETSHTAESDTERGRREAGRSR